ncbi:phage major capsid protein [Sinorhizobium meliloti]|uniref:phage major capsid protein n=1 Tax=Rhizobium meliloti TaxID=382 RepID=UPI0003FA802D|nr:phage major capsid protein [Sinorhizobium meliloti]
MKLHELQEKRAAAVTSMRTLADKVETESRDYTADEEKRHSDLKAEITSLDTKIQRARDVAEAERSAPAIIQGNGRDGAFEERARDFSITKAIAARLGDDVDAGFERELSQEVAKRSGRKFQGIAVPDEVFTEKRTLLAGSSAADLIPNVHRGDLFIDRLRSALVVGRLGATVLDNLVGTVDIPKQTGSSTAQWVAEDGSLTETDASFTDVNLAPKTVGAMTSFSRRTLINAVPSVEQLVRRDLAAVIASAIDHQALMGDGTGNTPTGIANTPGIATPSLAGPTWAQVLGVIASIQNEDADLGNLGWALNPSAVAKLRGTVKATGEGAGFLMEAPGNLAGYPAASTTAIPSAAGPVTSVFFGAWSQLLIGYWSGTDILVNPYETTAYAKGRVMVRAMRDVDIAVRHAESFAVADDLAA